MTFVNIKCLRIVRYWHIYLSCVRWLVYRGKSKITLFHLRSARLRGDFPICPILISRGAWILAKTKANYAVISHALETPFGGRHNPNPNEIVIICLHCSGYELLFFRIVIGISIELIVNLDRLNSERMRQLPSKRLHWVIWQCAVRTPKSNSGIPSEFQTNAMDHLLI